MKNFIATFAAMALSLSILVVALAASPAPVAFTAYAHAVGPINSQPLSVAPTTVDVDTEFDSTVEWTVESTGEVTYTGPDNQSVVSWMVQADNSGMSRGSLEVHLEADYGFGFVKIIPSTSEIALRAGEPGALSGAILLYTPQGTTYRLRASAVGPVELRALQNRLMVLEY